MPNDFRQLFALRDDSHLALNPSVGLHHIATKCPAPIALY
jgi:hypothetical protein